MSVEARAWPVVKAVAARSAAGVNARGIRSAVVLAAAIALASAGVACSGRAERARAPSLADAWTTASSTAPAVASSAPPSTPRDERPWELAPERLRSAARIATSHHGHGELSGEVLVNDAAGLYPALGPATPLAVGALLVEAERDVTTEPPRLEGYLLMRKREPGFDSGGGDWEYGIADAKGAFRARGVLAPCARCHADAPHDHVFGAH